MFKALGIITALFVLIDALGFTKDKLVSYFYIALIIIYGFAIVVMYALKNKNSQKRRSSGYLYFNCGRAYL